MSKQTVLMLAWLVVTAVGLASCEKMVLSEDDASAVSKVKDPTLVLRVTATETRADVNPGDVWETLIFQVYNQDSVKVADIIQTNDESSFGTAAFSLDEGDYRVVIVGHSSAGNPSVRKLSTVEFSKTTGYSDTFYAKADVHVTAHAKEQSITLQRATSLLRFKTTDGVPSDVKSIKFAFEGGSSVLDLNTGYGTTASKQEVFIDIDPAQTDQPLVADLYTILRADEASVKLVVTAYSVPKADVTTDNVESVTLYSRDFKSQPIPMLHHQITEFEGLFFAKQISVPFAVSADVTWAGTTSYTY